MFRKGEYKYMRSSQRKRKKYRIKSKSRFITSVVIMLGIIISGFSAVTGLNISTALTKPQYEYVHVKSGDTLWNIADRYKNDDTDIREAVFEISEANDGIEASDLYPGMVIAVPEEL